MAGASRKAKATVRITTTTTRKVTKMAPAHPTAAGDCGWWVGRGDCREGGRGRAPEQVVAQGMTSETVPTGRREPHSVMPPPGWGARGKKEPYRLVVAMPAQPDWSTKSRQPPGHLCDHVLRMRFDVTFIVACDQGHHLC
jgi:hypothetical protein